MTVIVRKHLSSICLILLQRIVHLGRTRIKFRHEKPISCNSSTWGISIFHSATVQSSILKSMFNQKKKTFRGFHVAYDIFPLNLLWKWSNLLKKYFFNTINNRKKVFIFSTFASFLKLLHFIK